MENDTRETIMGYPKPPKDYLFYLNLSKTDITAFRESLHRASCIPGVGFEFMCMGQLCVVRQELEP